MGHHIRRLRLALLLILLSTLTVPVAARAQTFVKVPAAGNGLLSDPATAGKAYAGCAWMDFDSDGKPDIFVSQGGLFKGDGAGGFTKVATGPMSQGTSTGTSWADFDNDGSIDCMTTAGSPTGTSFYRNVGGVFNKVVSGDLADSLNNLGWGCAFGDYDGDGYVDAVVAAAFGFSGINNVNRLFHNNGNGTLSRDFSTDVGSPTAPYTNATWSDFDGDGDADLFIATGPVSTFGHDYVYLNQLKQQGSPTLKYSPTFAPAVPVHDSQLWNWVDIDNDGDLDLFITNLSGGSPTGQQNEMWRNNGGGLLSPMTAVQAGGIVLDFALHLGSTWGDFDNDGSQDCIVTADGSGNTRYYHNDGTGRFTAVSIGTAIQAGPHWGASAADYDNDGDLDVFLTGTSTTRELLRNDLSVSNTHRWAEFTLVGGPSNRSAIGALVRVKATISGVTRWMVREVSAQNSFCGHNDLRVHFGLGNAAQIESLQVFWPSGLHEGTGSLSVNQRVTLREGEFGVTPVEMVWVGASALADGAVQLEWRTESGGRGEIQLQRRREGEPWKAIASLNANSDGRLMYLDRSAEPGARYGYRLAGGDGGPLAGIGEAWVDVPAARLALFGTRTNPSRSPIEIEYSLPDLRPGLLQVFRADGRMVASGPANRQGPGRNTVTISWDAPLAAGVYFVQLTHGRAAVCKRLVLLP